MEIQTLYDAVLGLLILGIGIVIRRFWHLTDQLRNEDSRLHDRITNVSLNYVQQKDFHVQVDRILDRIDKMEERVLQRES